MNLSTLNGSHHCAVCGGTDYRSVCEKDSARYVQCAQCGVVRQYPYPTQDEITKYYERYQSIKTTASSYLSDAGFAAFKRDKLLTFEDLGLAENSFTGKTVLDVGCATGQFIEMMISQGAGQARGIDASAECIASALARGLPCELGDFLQIGGHFDVITMWHLIEHLPRPQDFIKHAHSLLNAEGWLFIETPAIGLVSDAFGSNWRYFMPTEHINLFPIDSLIRICANAGFALKSHVRFGSGNDSEVVPTPNKQAMDKIAKKAGFGDTMALWLVKT